LSGNLSDGGQGYSLTLDGPGSLILAGSGSYNGGTIVESGTLILASPDGIGRNTSLVVGAGDTVDFDPTFASSPVVASASAVAQVPEPNALVLLSGRGDWPAGVHARRGQKTRHWPSTTDRVLGAKLHQTVLPTIMSVASIGGLPQASDHAWPRPSQARQPSCIQGGAVA
jgi:autotransporter-associated beta strand protein